MTLAYRVVLVPDDNGTVMVTAPRLPPLVTYGDTREAALHWALDAAYCVIGGLMQDGMVIPPGDAEPGDEDVVRFSWLVTLKAELHNRLVEAGVTRAELARRLNWHREQVDRLFRLTHASRIDQLESAFKALGVDDIEVRVAA